MKKVLLWATVIIAISAFTETNQPPEKKFTFTFTQNEVSVLYGCIDQSTAPHTSVVQVEKLISDQYQAQIDTTKKSKP